MKFYITGLYHNGQFNDRTLPPIEVEAGNRQEALASIRGVTVWTEAEWLAHSEIDLFDGLFKKGPQSCVGCSALTDDGAACVDYDLVYIDGPLRPVCAACHPKVSFEREP